VEYGVALHGLRIARVSVLTVCEDMDSRKPL